MLFLQAITLSFAGLGMATTFQAFFSSDCTTGAGTAITVSGGGTCSKVVDRHSYKVVGDNCNVWEFDGYNCLESLNYVKRYLANGGCRTNMNGVLSACVNGTCSLAFETFD